MTVEEFKEKMEKLEDAMKNGTISSKNYTSEKRKLTTYNSDIVKQIRESEEK